ncbi:tetratricopeptide repeat protein [Lactococcus petauri]|uniref:tetratricopeptide repeat protein n=1 Tax=Lactococcus petauri TaxID=1940789 RepID=UPI0038519CFF
MNNKEKTIVKYLKAIELNPEDTTAYFNLGNVYSALNKNEEAIVQYLKAIELNPEDTTAYFNLGNVYSELNKNEEAIVQYLKVIELNPEDAIAYFNLGNVYSKLKKNEEALAQYLKSLKLDPEDADIYNNLGNVYSELDKNEEAIEQYFKAIELNPKYDAPYFNLGNIYLKINKTEEAIEQYLKAIEINPKYADAYFNLGVSYSNIKQNDKAIVQYLKSLTLNPNDADAYFNLGNIYSELNKNEEAMTHYLKAIKYNLTYESALNKIVKYLTNNFPLSTLEELLKEITTKDIEKMEILVAIFKHSCLVKENKKLYHYTSLSTLQSMLEPITDSKDSRKLVLRLYNTEYMNDPEEGAFFAKTLEKFNDKNGKTISKSFITSLTENEDEIPNWESYGDSHQGICLGINVDIGQFVNPTPSIKSEVVTSTFVEKPRLYKVHYYIEPAKNASLETENYKNQLVQEIKKIVSTQTKINRGLLLCLDQIKFLIKNNNYHYENEYRIIEHVENYARAKFDSHNPKLFIEFENFKITEITFGAKCNNYYEYLPFIQKQMNINSTFDIKNIKTSQIKIR